MVRAAPDLVFCGRPHADNQDDTLHLIIKNTFLEYVPAAPARMVGGSDGTGARFPPAVSAEERHEVERVLMLRLAQMSENLVGVPRTVSRTSSLPASLPGRTQRVAQRSRAGTTVEESRNTRGEEGRNHIGDDSPKGGKDSSFNMHVVMLTPPKSMSQPGTEKRAIQRFEAVTPDKSEKPTAVVKRLRGSVAKAKDKASSAETCLKKQTHSQHEEEERLAEQQQQRQHQQQQEQLHQQLNQLMQENLQLHQQLQREKYTQQQRHLEELQQLKQLQVQRLQQDLKQQQQQQLKQGVQASVWTCAEGQGNCAADEYIWQVPLPFQEDLQPVLACTQRRTPQAPVGTEALANRSSTNFLRKMSFDVADSDASTDDSSTDSSEDDIADISRLESSLVEPTDGSRNFTTVMLRNLPNNYSRTMILELIDGEGFAGQYDFLYLPMDFQSKACLGYAFVNLTSHCVANLFRERFRGFRQWRIPSRKDCGVSWSNPHQGLQANIERYRNSPVMHFTVPDEYRPVVFSNGVRIPFPAPTKHVARPRPKHFTQQVNWEEPPSERSARPAGSKQSSLVIAAPPGVW